MSSVGRGLARHTGSQVFKPPVLHKLEVVTHPHSLLFWRTKGGGLEGQVIFGYLMTRPA